MNDGLKFNSESYITSFHVEIRHQNLARLFLRIDDNCRLHPRRSCWKGV